ncbi:MAG TPA: methyltransferase domain-containing protein [Pyrinomonadaceae bacterium]|nr:methyltransferase domain-containing protein [Pyrinomonadaceae bacterium]
MTDRPPVYDRLAAHYDRWMRPLERMGLRALRARVLGELPEGALLLEVGAGTGANFEHYPRAAVGAAVEPSGEMLARAARRAERPRGVQLIQSRAEQLPFADASFDAAFATLVFCSVASPAAGFSELRRVVRPGGVVALLEHVRPRWPLGYAFDALSFLTERLFEDHFNRRTALEAERAGLSVVRVEERLLGALQLIVCRAD